MTYVTITADVNLDGVDNETAEYEISRALHLLAGDRGVAVADINVHVGV